VVLILRDLSGLAGRMPKVCLTMIVKNEGHCIARCLSSVKHLITAWCIVDTGSSDNTMEEVRRELAGIPGELHERPWVNFGVNRTEAAELAAQSGCDWLLVMDADETAEGDFSDLAWAHDCMGINVENGEEVGYRLSLLSTKRPWVYPEKIHESPNCTPGKPRRIIESLRIIHHGDGGRHTDGWQQRDIDLITSEPMGIRQHFHLGMMLYHANRYGEALGELAQCLGPLTDIYQMEFVLRICIRCAESMGAPEPIIDSLKWQHLRTQNDISLAEIKADLVS
jgi:glycosyltransferase involved in cell wall biosynthesis